MHSHTLYRMGDTRIMSPFPMKALSLWVVLRLWPDVHDRRVLVRYQQQLRQRPEKQPFRTPRQRILPAAESLDAALQYLTHRYIQDLQYQARLLFGEVAQQVASQFGIHRPYDMLAAWSGLVKRNFADGIPTTIPAKKEGEEPTIVVDIAPIELHSLIGAMEIDSMVIEDGRVAATAAAFAICEAIKANYPEDAAA